MLRVFSYVCLLKVGYLGVEPSLSCSQNRRITVFLAPDTLLMQRVFYIIAYLNAQRYQALLGSRCGP